MALDGRNRRRVAAVAALALGAVTAALAGVLAYDDWWRALASGVLLAAALAWAWAGVRRGGAGRAAALVAAAVLAAGAVAIFVRGHPLLMFSALATLVATLAIAARAFRARIGLARAPRPARPVLVYNPRSGGGKAERFRVAEEARARGIEPIALTGEVPLEQLIRGAFERGADALAVAGGDGSQAIGAALAAERGVPYACIPAGTRNHFALDLGVDRDDVVGALDALVSGGEKLVDLGDVNGRVFVNNVSLGLYGRAVQQPGYRAAKLRTIVDTVPEALGPEAKPDLRWRGPAGEERRGGAAIVVSNNPYRLGPALGAGTRPRLDAGLLGVAVLPSPDDEAAPSSWAAASFELDADGPVPAGLDGEAVVLQPPLRFSVRRRVLRVRIARHHPGASPSAFLPERLWEAVTTLARIAAGRDPRPVPGGALAGGER